MFSLRHENRDIAPAAYDRFSIAFLFVLSALLMLRQLASSSYFTVVIDDAFIYPSWAWQFSEALKEGTIYPRWLPLNFWGYGSPTFLLYPPLAYYLVALFNLFTDSIISAMNLAKFASLFFSAAGVYYLVKEFYPARAALLSAAFCIILPYNIALMYLYGSFAAMVSCMWFAPILLFLYRYFNTGERRYLVLAGACYGSLILTHLIIAYMFTFVIVAFGIYMAVVRKKIGDVLLIPAILLIGLSLSAAYILPVMLERNTVNLDTFINDANAIIYSNMFLLPDLTARFSHGYFWPIYYKTMVQHAVIFCLFITVFLVMSFKTAKQEHRGLTQSVNRFFLMTATCSILLMLGISTFLWKTVPFFKYILFPTRWLHITAFAASFSSASVFTHVAGDNRYVRISVLLSAILLLSCMAWDYQFITGAPSFDRKELFPAIAVNSIMEHLPKGVRLDRIDDKQRHGKAEEITVQGEGSSRVILWKSAERVVDVKAERPVVVRFRTFNFPGWCAFVDGRPTAIATENDTRAILVNVPGGRHRITLEFRDTPVRLAGKLISLASVTALVVILAAKKIGPGKAV